jgi:hypothetical protein
MEQEYRISFWYKIFYGIGVAAIVGFNIFLLSKISSSNNTAPGIIILLIFFTGALILSLYIIKRKVVISDSSIVVSGIFGTREFLNINVKGFRIESRAIFIYSSQEGVRRLMINDYDAIERTDELIEMLNKYYADLDVVERTNALVEILNDHELGYSENERNEKLESAKRKALIYNIGGGILFFSFFSKNYDFAVCLIAFLYPLIGIFLIISGKGLIKFFTKKNSPLPSLYVGMYIPSIVLMIITIVDYHIINHNDIWMPFLFICSVLIIVISIKGIAKSSGAAQYIILLIIALFYGYGSVLFINCGFDRSSPQVFDSVVTDRYKTKDIPYIRLSDWGNYKEFGEIKVLSSFYDQVQTGSTVKVKVKKGGLNIPWYYVDL